VVRIKSHCSFNYRMSGTTTSTISPVHRWWRVDVSVNYIPHIRKEQAWFILSKRGLRFFPLFYVCFPQASTHAQKYNANFPNTDIVTYPAQLPVNGKKHDIMTEAHTWDHIEEAFFPYRTFLHTLSMWINRSTEGIAIYFIA
jgi:hypothetical protein